MLLSFSGANCFDIFDVVQLSLINKWKLIIVHWELKIYPLFIEIWQNSISGSASTRSAPWLHKFLGFSGLLWLFGQMGKENLLSSVSDNIFNRFSREWQRLLINLMNRYAWFVFYWSDLISFLYHHRLSNRSIQELVVNSISFIFVLVMLLTEEVSAVQIIFFVVDILGDIYRMAVF